MLFEIKIFGGANVISGMTSYNIGGKNIDFVKKYLKQESLSIDAENVGGECGRKIIYNPLNGKVLVKHLARSVTNAINTQEQDYLKSLKGDSLSGDIEIF